MTLRIKIKSKTASTHPRIYQLWSTTLEDVGLISRNQGSWVWILRQSHRRWLLLWQWARIWTPPVGYLWWYNMLNEKRTKMSVLILIFFNEQKWLYFNIMWTINAPGVKIDGLSIVFSQLGHMLILASCIETRVMNLNPASKSPMITSSVILLRTPPIDLQWWYDMLNEKLTRVTEICIWQCSQLSFKLCIVDLDNVEQIKCYPSRFTEFFCKLLVHRFRNLKIGKEVLCGLRCFWNEYLIMKSRVNEQYLRKFLIKLLQLN